MTTLRRMLHYETLEQRCLLSTANPTIAAIGQVSLARPTLPSRPAIVLNTNTPITAAPTVTGVSPVSGPATGGTTVTIAGTNLASATAVKFGAAVATIVSDTATRIVATSPVGSAGAVDVTVATAAGVSKTSAADKFSYVSAPAVTGVSPATGSMTGGTAVTIMGTDLTGATAVKFGATAATIVSDTATRIVVTSPAGSVGTVDVTVTTVGGTSQTSAADNFTYVLEPILTVSGVVQNETTPTAANETAFVTVAAFQQTTDTFTIVNQGNASLQLTGAPLVAVSGAGAGDFQVTQQPATTIAAGGSTTFAVTFAPQAAGVAAATLTIRSNAANAPSYAFAIDGAALAVPPVLNVAPAAGIRAKVVLPQYAGTNVYEALYLPTDWKPGGSYPVIVEFAPNDYPEAGVNGTVDDTRLGYYESGGKGYIWVTMPFINYTTRPASNATEWWGNGNETDAEGVQLTAQYCEAALIQILQNYGGNPAEVFVTGFSRGSIATSVIGLATQQMADIWAGFIPDSWEDSNTADLARTDGRPTFLIAGGDGDGGCPASAAADQFLVSQGFPTQFAVIPNIGHTDSWIQNGSSDFDLGVQTQLRQWMTQVIETHPGTHSISGTVTNAQGRARRRARVQSGATHWVTTDANGNFTLPGLINGPRVLTVSYGTATVSEKFTMAGSNVQGMSFVYSGGANPSLVP